ncbi:DnaJ domain-containing protein, partial [uncultured Thiocystis sp.]|uniref:J domain-containing protein n=1 Tax=uncultured Thiocystis sp. TaxID=1202134 RepID=UPI0025EB64B8
MALKLGQTPADIEKAARFFIRQVLVVPEADHYRLLGLSRHASEATVRLHYQLLVRLFHPDRPTAEAELDSTFTARINDAYSTLRGAETRRLYDEQLATLAVTTYPPTDVRTFFLPTKSIFASSSHDSRSTNAASKRWQVVSAGLLIGFGLMVSVFVVRLRIDTTPVMPPSLDANRGIQPKPNHLDQDTGAREAQLAEVQPAEIQRIEAQPAEAKHIEAPRTETQRAEAQRIDAQRAETQRIEAQRIETQRAEAQRAEAQRNETQRAEAQRIEAQRAETQRVEAQRIETQRAEAQRVEAQRAEAQRI